MQRHEIARIGTAGGDLGDQALDVVHVAEQVARGLAQEGRLDELLDAPLAVGDRVDLAQWRQQPLAQQAPAHRCACAVERFEQRAFLAAADGRLHPSEEDLNRPATAFRPAMTPPWGSDVRAVLRIELQDIDAMAQRALGRAGNAMTRIHLRDVRMEIERILSTER